MGFTLTPEERDALVAKDPRNAERIFPYLGGAEVNTSPTHAFDRYVINFGDMTLEQAETWPDLIAIVREKVKPERDKLRNNPDGRRLKQTWWQPGRRRPELYAAIAPLDRCLVTACVSKHLCFSFQPTDRVFSHQLYALPLPGYAPFAILQSRVHEVWVRLLSSTMNTGVRYAATDCFETFPFPEETSSLEAIGERYYSFRANYLISNNIGLTEFYNNPPKGLPELDRAVEDAYGWYDSPSDDEVIDRLFLLNLERESV